MNRSLKKYKIIIAIELIILLIPIIFMIIMTIEDMRHNNAYVGADPSVERRIFNDRFTGYAGNKRAQDVKGLILAITANNGQNRVNKISVEYKSASGGTNIGPVTTGLGAISAQVNTQRRYEVTIEDIEPVDGYYDTITIIEQPSGMSTTQE